MLWIGYWVKQIKHYKGLKVYTKKLIGHDNKLVNVSQTNPVYGTPLNLYKCLDDTTNATALPPVMEIKIYTYSYYVKISYGYQSHAKY